MFALASEEISDGKRIRSAGRVVNEVQSKDRRPSPEWSFRNYALYPHNGPSRQNLAFGLKLRKFGQGRGFKRRVYQGRRIAAVGTLRYLKELPSTAMAELAAVMSGATGQDASPLGPGPIVRCRPHAYLDGTDAALESRSASGCAVQVPAPRSRSFNAQPVVTTIYVTARSNGSD